MSQTKKVFKVLSSTLTIISLLFSFLGVPAKTSAVPVEQTNAYSVVFNGRTLNAGNTSTWSYTLYKSGDGPSSPDLSHWVWVVCDDLDIDEIYISSNPTASSVGFDGSTLHYGVKWEMPEDFDWGPEGKTFTVTIEGQPEVDNTGATAVIKAGRAGDHGCNPHFDLVIPGPSCAQPPEPYCGDGVKNGQEECDGTDGVPEHYTCTSECTLEYIPYCGDQIINGNEVCEIGDTEACETSGGYQGYKSCNQDCLGWGECIAYESCGDGVVNDSEECDAGAQNGQQCTPPYGGSCDYCSNICKILNLKGPFCGDQQINGSEICEIGETKECETSEGYTGSQLCNDECLGWDECVTDQYCGDRVINGDEQCDDGNTHNGDGCSSDCEIEEPQCIPEGGSGVVIPGAQSCCPGLTQIGCDQPDQSGNCPTSPCAGAFYCTMCGNGICGLGENKCNCPEDCHEETCDYKCFVPDSLNDTQSETISPNSEITLQTFLNNNGYTINVEDDQTNIQVWETTTASPELEITYLGKNAGYPHAFGYYLNSDIQTFVPVFEDAEHPLFSAPIANPGDKFTINIDQNDTVGFAINESSSNPQKYAATENSLNDQGADRVLVFDLCSEFVLGFNDSYLDSDYQDIVVSVKRISCTSTPFCGDGTCNGEETCETCSQDCGSCPQNKVTISAQKVVCQTEADLPNWGTSGTVPGKPSQITSTTATDFVANSQGKCSLASGWDFQWGFNGEVSSPNGSDIGPGGTGWHNFDSSTGSGTPAQVEITDLKGISTLWVKENLKEDYQPFAGPPGDLQNNISAEMYCHEDILNYDNYDYISNTQLGNTYYCVAFNALTPPPQPVCGNGIIEAGEQCDDGNTQNGDGCSSTCTIEGGQCIPEGGSGAVVPGELSCCPGLTQIGCSQPIGPQFGGCSDCVGAFFCTYCGNGICGLGENACNCPADCKATIYGTVFKDLNTDGIFDAGEPGIENVLITLDGTATDTTDSNGAYSFSVTTEGNHEVVETDTPGYYSTTPNTVNINTVFGNSYKIDFGDAITMVCTPGATQSCSTGLLGICAGGTQTCTELGVWGTCIQTNQPATEICGNGIDEDCNGSDLACPPGCTPEATQTCSTGLLGICTAGTQTCSQLGTWGSCVQTNQPISENCTNGLDDDCDGYIDGADPDCPHCGDGSCNNGETCGTCSQDCGGCGGVPFCGDNSCNNGETCGTCPQDCGGCGGTPFCGDGICNALETCGTCSQDCGSCGGGVSSYCGDGIVNGSEQCDGTAGISTGYTCTASCALEKTVCNMDLDVMMVMDVSGSMGYETPTRLSQAKIAANNFLGNLRSEDQSGLVSFNWTATLNKSLSNQHSLTQSAINGLTALGATDISDAIDKANQELISANANPDALKVQILLTDGLANRPNGNGNIENSNDVALTIAKSLEAANNGIIIFTIGLGNSVNNTMLQTVASNTGGQYYFAPAASDLERTFNQIAHETCNYKNEFKLPTMTIYNERIESVSGSNVTVSWYTNIPGTSRVVYNEQPVLSPGSSPNYGYAYSTPETDTNNKVIFHLVTLNNLTPKTTYYWRPISHGSGEVLGQESTFSTVTAETSETPTTPETPITPGTPTENETPTPSETEAQEFSMEAGKGLLSGLAAAVSNFFTQSIFCSILLLVTLILIVLLGLTIYQSRKKENIIWTIAIIVLIGIILYRAMCFWRYWWLIILIAVIVAGIAYFLGEKKNKQGKIEFLK